MRKALEPLEPFVRRPFVAWAIVYCALTIAVTFPLAVRLTSTVGHDLGDPLMSVSILWWNAHVLPLTERWWNGFAFFPASGMLAFSDHRLGESLIASPLQWIGCSPVTAYNITFLATFPLCALAAHALGLVLTRRHDAAAICGLAYGFNPYRMAHLAHLELLAAFGMPAALAALHLALTTRRRRWAVVFGAALVLQGLCTSYYIAFFAVLLGLWIVWFVRWQDRWLLPRIAGALLCLVVALLPLALEYTRVHRFYGMSRTFEEVLSYSADVTSLVTANVSMALWGWTAGLNAGEAQIFPGFIVAMIVVVGALVSLRTRKVARDRGSVAAAVLCIVAAVYLAVAVSTLYFGAWHVEAGPFKAAADVFYKPFSIAVVAALLAVAVSARARDAWSRRSTLGFYVVATLAMFVCSFGPKPTFLGWQVLYKPPYEWLMQLPVFSTEIRAPARFAMLGALTLSAAGAVAFDRLARDGRARSMVAALLMIGVVADGWIRELPTPRLPDAVASERAPGFDTVVEMPLGGIAEDMAAMYRATIHRQKIINGASGYTPSAYLTLATGVQEKDGNVIDAFAGFGHVLVAVDDSADADHFWRGALGSRHDVTPFGREPGWSLFSVAAHPAAPVCDAPSVDVAGAFDDHGPVDVARLRDRDILTLWQGQAQHAGDAFVIDMGKPIAPCALRVSIGADARTFPRRLAVSVSQDRTAWTTVFEGSTLAQAVRGALARPTDTWLEFPLTEDAPSASRFVRLQLLASQPTVPWQITEVDVRGRELSAEPVR